MKRMAFDPFLWSLDSGVIMAAFTQLEILNQLDRFAGKEDYQFPMLDHGYWYPVGARLSAYRDSTHWAIVFEQFAYNPRGGAHGGIDLIVSPFGNCLVQRPTPNQIDFHHFIRDGPEGATFVQERGRVCVAYSARTIRVQGQLLPITTDPTAYALRKIPLEDARRVEPQDLMRLLYPPFREIFYATDEKLRARLTVDLPLVLRLYGWQHPRVLQGELPSQSPSMIAIAEMLATDCIFDFADPGVDNVHWSNWPEGGSL